MIMGKKKQKEKGVYGKGIRMVIGLCVTKWLK